METLRLMILDHTLFILTLIPASFLVYTNATTTIIASAPVHPVQVGGIFSLRCEVIKMKGNQELTIFHTSKDGSNKRLSVNDEVLDDAGDRVYLAVRQMNDGKTVYLLSIMTVSREDEGVYICKLFDMDVLNWVSEDSFSLQVMYVPGDSDPTCGIVESTTVMEGTEIDLDCSSERAFPEISLQWSRTGGRLVPKTTTSVEGNRVFSSFTFVPTMADQNVVFLCGIKSVAFPAYDQTCHVGPFKVYRNPNIPRDNQNNDHDNKGVIYPPSVDNSNHNSKDEDRNRLDIHSDNGESPLSDLNTKCLNSCIENRYSVLYWIIATIVACVLATFFFIMGLVLVLKYRRLTIQPKPTYYLAQHPVDDIYTELECKRGDATVYMSLTKHGQPTTPAVSAVQKGPTLEPITDGREKHYNYETKLTDHC